MLHAGQQLWDSPVFARCRRLRRSNRYPTGFVVASRTRRAQRPRTPRLNASVRYKTSRARELQNKGCRARDLGNKRYRARGLSDKGFRAREVSGKAARLRQLSECPTRARSPGSIRATSLRCAVTYSNGWEAMCQRETVSSRRTTGYGPTALALSPRSTSK